MRGRVHADRSYHANRVQRSRQRTERDLQRHQDTGRQGAGRKAPATGIPGRNVHVRLKLVGIRTFECNDDSVSFEKAAHRFTFVKSNDSADRVGGPVTNFQAPDVNVHPIVNGEKYFFVCFIHCKS